MGRRERHRGGRRGLVILVAVVFLLLLAEGALVAAVFVSPSTGERLEGLAASADRLWNGTQRSPGLRDRAARTAREAFEGWIAPLWEPPRTPAPEPGFTACVDCHPDYAKQRRFGVYMNHPLHAELGVACVDCHPENPHPSPPLPQESVCADCHPEVQDPEACGTCHPPGSLPHFYLLGAPRDAAVRCDVCHPRGAFDVHATEPLVQHGDLSGRDPETCRSCHTASSCESCHAVGHPAGWLTDHGSEVGYVGPTDCYRCHTSMWCGSMCHTGQPAPQLPLPTGGVR